MSAESVKSIRALARGLQVLRLLNEQGAQTLAALHAETAIPKATLLRILKTLREEGAVWQRIIDGAYLPTQITDATRPFGREALLVEVASPVLEQLSDKVKWPSVLAVPRPTHLEVVEANAPRAEFNHIGLGPVGFRINFLRSATGRAFLAYCAADQRAAILNRLREGGRKGDTLALSDAEVDKALSETRDLGYGLRHPDFGGGFDEGRNEVDDGRDSLGVAIRFEDTVLGAINVTWSKRALNRTQAAALLAEPAMAAAEEIAARFAARLSGFTQ